MREDENYTTVSSRIVGHILTKTKGNGDNNDRDKGKSKGTGETPGQWAAAVEAARAVPPEKRTAEQKKIISRLDRDLGKLLATADKLRNSKFGMQFAADLEWC